MEWARDGMPFPRLRIGDHVQFRLTRSNRQTETKEIVFEKIAQNRANGPVMMVQGTEKQTKRQVFSTY